ncbi:MAG: hypothetical protein ACOC3V_04645, partial [bacterium]
DLMYGGVGPLSPSLDVDDSNTNTPFNNAEIIRIWLSTDDDLTPNINLDSTFNTSITIVDEFGASDNISGRVINVVNITGVNVDSSDKNLGQIGTPGSLGNNNSAGGENLSIVAGTGRGYIDVELYTSGFPSTINIIISSGDGRLRTNHPLKGSNTYGLIGNSSSSLVFEYELSP